MHLFVVGLFVQNSSAQVVANFTADDTVGYAPLTVNFTNESTGYVTLYIWSFGDGGSSVDANPSYTYTTSGVYSVELTATNELFGDGITKTNYITVNPNPLPPIITSFSPTSDSAGETVTINGQHLTNTTAVYFGTTRAASFTFVSDNIITAVVGDGSSGAVYLTKPGIVDSLPGFTYIPPKFTLVGPAITSFSPASGPKGTVVNIIGNNFSDTAVNNIVYFGAVRAAIIKASTDTLTVIVPGGTTFEPITVTTKNLTAYSEKPFYVTFAGGDTTLTSYSFASHIDYPCGALPLSVEAKDLDNDSIPDLVTANEYGNAVSLYKNSSVFQKIFIAPKADIGDSSYPYQAISSDLNGDGWPDILIDNASPGTMTFLTNNGINNTFSFSKSNFTINGVLQTGGVISAGDMDGDGKPDLIVPTGNDSIQAFRNTSTGPVISFAGATNFALANTGTDNGYTSVICDLDGDGKPDYATIAGGSSLDVYKNISYPGKILLALNQAVNFQDAYNINMYLPNSLLAADLNGDGKPDLIFASSYNNTSFSIWLNTSAGGIISFAAPISFNITGNVVAITVNDFNGDGKPDIAAALQAGSVAVFLNSSANGNLSFKTQVNYPVAVNPEAITSVDIDRDGKPDIVVANETTNSISILRNQMNEPIKDQLCPPVGGTTLVSTLSGTAYQWQQSTDSIHFNNISNNANFNGANSDTLQLSNIPSSWYGYQYRCIVDGNNSNVYTLQFTDAWTGAVNSSWSNASNWSCGAVPDSNTDVIINSGTVVLSSNVSIRSLTVDPSASFTILTPYNLTVTH